jgi:hypothetical protein
MFHKTNWRKGLAAVAAIVPLALMGGCSNGLQGAFSGAALGSLAGLGIGSVTGDRSDAVTMGAILGGVGGAVIGDQNARASAYSTSGGGGSYGHTTERVVERPVYTDRTVYVERPVYVQPSPVVIYKSGGHHGHYRHYSGHRSWGHGPRYYGPSRHRGSPYHCW